MKRPGYYTLSEVHGKSEDLSITAKGTTSTADTDSASLSSGQFQGTSVALGGSSTTLFPTVFDDIHTAQGITPYSNLAQVQVTRRQAISRGSGRLSS